ncbi:SDR family oxidoreductase [Kutzneria albida]|uniref:Short-chain dehydrogenase/reductase SDR n=1 Tax=Kutzneria albida DSM 43870 TaxID=1449976 RepID=W5WSR3_9PSEU|nr:SDR family oxidoreductase [Kutzneria albida]AHI01180.1 hypothetical protein KALB_7822 [Kutzneria albida DSM 43870]
MPVALDKKVALVTGGSKGIGLAVARKLAASGCRVLINYAGDEAAATQAASEVDGELLRGDVFAPGGTAELLRSVGRLDVFVHNAASWHPMPTGRVDPAGLRADVEAALNPLLDAITVLPEVMPEGGRVVALSSNGSSRVIPAYVALGVAKAALESLVRYAAVELAPKGIAVNAVSTGKVDKGPGTPNAQLIPMLAARTPAGRLTTPADVADAVALLCAEEAGWIHGQVLTADGGLGLLS